MENVPYLSVVIEAKEGDKNRIETARRVHAFCAAKGVTCEVARDVKEARGKYVLVMDTRLETPVKEVDVLIAALTKGADIAVGTRKTLFGQTPCNFKCLTNSAANSSARDLKTVSVPVMWMKPHA